MDISLKSLIDYIEKNNYKGFDPYDALKSPFINNSIFKDKKFIKFLVQQFVKRFIFNLRPILRINKGYNPVTLGLCMYAYLYLYLTYKDKKYYHKIYFLIEELLKLSSKNFSGLCWGYDFEWQGRHAEMPAYYPTVVATGIISNAFFKIAKELDCKKSKKIVLDSSKFILNDLNKSYFKDGSFCYSYSPGDNLKVFNAHMKGVRILSQAYFFSKKKELKEQANLGVKFLINNINDNNSWNYSLKKTGNWIDNYHTGYVLNCLKDYCTLTENNIYNNILDRSYNYYKKNLITEKFLPKFFNNKTYPIDCTSASQTILTAIKFNDIDIAQNVKNQTCKIMQNSNGGFIFRKYNILKNKTSFMRWSDAWMFAAMSKLNYEISK